MARTYSRDSRGRFSGGGGGGGKKGGSTRSKNTARAKELKAAGTTGIGSRVKAKGFAGGKGAQQRAGGLRTSGTATARVRGKGVGAGSRRGLKASAAAVGKARSKAASKGTRKMSKAPANAAKARFKQLSGAARQSGAMRSAAENRKAAGAKRSLKSMIAKRGRK